MLDRLHSEREDLKEMLATGSVEESQISGVIGRAEAIRLILNSVDTFENFTHFYIGEVNGDNYSPDHV